LESTSMTRSPAARTTPSILAAHQALALLGRPHRDRPDRDALARLDPVERQELVPTLQAATQDAQREQHQVEAEEPLVEDPARRDAGPEPPDDAAGRVPRSDAQRHQKRRISTMALLRRPARRPSRNVTMRISAATAAPPARICWRRLWM